MGKKAVNKKKILEHIFDRVAPGTALREAIDKIQEAKLGALLYQFLKEAVYFYLKYSRYWEHQILGCLGEQLRGMIKIVWKY